MSPQTSPGWRKAFDRVEGALGPPLESAANAPQFHSLLVIGRRAQRAVGRRVDGAASWALHQAGLPSWRDVRSLRRQIGSLQQEVGALRRELPDPERNEDGRR
jgi:hypothetical protein